VGVLQGLKQVKNDCKNLKFCYNRGGLGVDGEIPAYAGMTFTFGGCIARLKTS